MKLRKNLNVALNIKFLRNSLRVDSLLNIYILKLNQLMYFSLILDSLTHGKSTIK